MGKTFTPLFDCVVERYGVVIASVFGKVARFGQMQARRCTAAQSRIAEELGLSRQTVNAHISRLVDDKFLIDLTPDRINGPHEYRIGPSFKNNGVKIFDTPVKGGVKGSVKGSVKKPDTKKAKKAKKVKETIKAVAEDQPNPESGLVATATAETVECLELLKNAGVGKKKAEELTRLPHVTPTYLRAHIEHFQAEQTRLEKLGQPLKGIGLLITRIAEGDPEPKRAGVAQFTYEFSDYDSAESEAVETGEESSAPASEEPSAKNEWAGVLTKLNGTLGKDAAEALRACHQVSATAELLVIGVPSQQTRDWLDNRLRSRLEHEAGKIIELVVGAPIPLVHTNGKI